jgi:hypothetical protein
LEEWANLRSIKVALRRALEHHRLFLEDVKTMNGNHDLSLEDVPLVATLLPLLVEATELRNRFFKMFDGSEGMLRVLCRILNGDQVFYKEVPSEILHKLTGWQVVGTVLSREDEEASPIMMLCFKTTGHIARLSRLFKSVGNATPFIKGLCMDICRAWNDRKYAADVEKVLKKLQPRVLIDMMRYMKERWNLPAAIYLSNSDAEFSAAFPSLAGLLHFNEDELSLLSQAKKQKTLNAIAKLFKLELEEIFEATILDQDQ